LTQVSWSEDSGSTLNAIASMLFVPSVPLAVGTGAIGVVVLFLNCPQLNKPPAPPRLIVEYPATAVKPDGQPAVLLVVVGPELAQSNGGFATLWSLTLPSPPVREPCSMKSEGGVAPAFINPTTSASNARATKTPSRAGWRAISVMLFDNSVTSR